MNLHHRFTTSPSGARSTGSKGLALAVLATAQLVIALAYSIVDMARPDIGWSLGFSGDPPVGSVGLRPQIDAIVAGAVPMWGAPIWKADEEQSMAKLALVGLGPMGTPIANRRPAGHGSAVIRGTVNDHPGSAT